MIVSSFNLLRVHHTPHGFEQNNSICKTRIGFRTWLIRWVMLIWAKSHDDVKQAVVCSANQVTFHNSEWKSDPNNASRIVWYPVCVEQNVLISHSDNRPTSTCTSWLGRLIAIHSWGRRRWNLWEVNRIHLVAKCGISHWKCTQTLTIVVTADRLPSHNQVRCLAFNIHVTVVRRAPSHSGR